MDLQQYDQMKMDLAEVLRSATMRPLPEGSQEAVRDLFARLSDDRFNLVVVGRFSRGKSTLMNAMLGAGWLPTGIVPVTSVITTVTYGSLPQVVLYYQNTNLFREIPIAELKDHVTERGNPGNRRRIRTAEIQIPAEILRRGFHFIDTPGLGSSIIENTRTTESFLPQVDAFVLVTSFDSPLSEDEQRILHVAHDSGRRVFVIINKQDLVNEEQRREVVDHLQTQLAQVFEESSMPPVFPLSAEEALGARTTGDGAKLDGSGLPAFETMLVNFLVNEKRREFLLNMSKRIGDLLDVQPDAMADLERLRALRTEIEAAKPEMGAISPAASIPISSTIASCEVCTAILESNFEFTAKYQYDLYGKRQSQAELSERRGLCASHTSYFETMAAPSGICTAMSPVVQRRAGELRALAAHAADGRMACEAVAASLPTRETCPICEVAMHTANKVVRELSRRLTQDADAQLQNLSAICLPHLQLLLEVIDDRAVVRRVLNRQSDLLDRVSEDMRRFAMKRDGMMRHLITKEEESAGSRGLRILVGDSRAQLGPRAEGHSRGNSRDRQAEGDPAPSSGDCDGSVVPIRSLAAASRWTPPRQ